MPNSLPRDESSDASLGPSQGLRTLITFLIFLHLFALFVAVSSRATAKGGEFASIEMALRKVPLVQAYAQFLRMDLSYTHWLTRGPFDGPDLESDHWIEAELTMPDGSTRLERVPAAAPMLRQRYWRYEALARGAASLSPDDDRASIIPLAVAARLMAETGATGGTIRVMQKTFADRPYNAASVTTSTPYSARIVVSADGLSLHKVERDADLAPVPTSRAGAANPTEGR